MAEAAVEAGIKDTVIRLLGNRRKDIFKDTSVHQERDWVYNQTLVAVARTAQL